METNSRKADTCEDTFLFLPRIEVDFDYNYISIVISNVYLKL